jgi:hypothetical protein
MPLVPNSNNPVRAHWRSWSRNDNTRRSKAAAIRTATRSVSSIKTEKNSVTSVTSIRPRGSEVAQAPGDPEASHYHRVERHQKQLVKWMVLARGLQSTKYIRDPPRLFWGLPSAFTPQLDAPVPRPTLREGTGTVWISPGDPNW